LILLILLKRFFVFEIASQHFVTNASTDLFPKRVFWRISYSKMALPFIPLSLRLDFQGKG